MTSPRDPSLRTGCDGPVVPAQCKHVAKVGDRRYLSVGEAALALRVSRTSIYRAVKRGTLPAVQLQPRGALRIPTEALWPTRRL
jgi:excisionase family DNA binding protein